METSDVKRLIAAEVRRQMREFRCASDRLPRDFETFKRSFALTLLESGGTDREVDDARRSDGRLFEIVWNSWQCVEAESRYVTRNEESALWRELHEIYVATVVHDILSSR